ncbi:hypothetical protein GOP47_0005895 [Adiantum capillus-veneris]|uniref:SANTA domain-containing protein n=2 Tax=Adiantum capillus-veneris TaxID=13818 RepID=A0A9D4V1Y1_ADICA|nr:hypothetical protein GOP47_0005895 [Adiantum capillus-veneris]
MEPPAVKGCGACGAQSTQITLHSWYLLRRAGCSDSVEVSVGGVIGTGGMERFETGAIVRRLEKCRLLAQDKVEVRLVGLIDDCTSVSNGFSVNLVQSFLSGFPYTWNHLLHKEFHTSSTSGGDHQVLGDCGLDAAAEVSQLSSEGCCLDQERKAPSLSQKEVSCDHLETCTDVELNTKQSMTEEAQTEKESKSLSTQAVSEDNEKLEKGILKDDQLKISDVTGAVEQYILDSSNKTMEGLQENVLIDQSRCNAKKKRVRKFRPHISGDQGDNRNTPIDVSRIQSPRITRLSVKISRHAASNDEQEVFRSLVESEICSFSSSLIQENVDEDSHSARRFSKQNNIDKGDGSKALKAGPCHNLEGTETHVEIEAQRPERSLNAEGSQSFEDDGAIIQEENIATEASPENVCNAVAEKESLHMVTQASDVMETLVSKTCPINHKKVKESSKEGSISTRSSRQCSKRQSIPPLPCPRVPIAKELISTAFGLKTSRSGRLLVPPLAHWCGQSLLRDKDGGIIAISDGSKDVNNDGAESFKFKPPAEKSLKKLQKQLREAAIDWTPSKKKRCIWKKIH